MTDAIYQIVIRAMTWEPPAHEWGFMAAVEANLREARAREITAEIEKLMRKGA